MKRALALIVLCAFAPCIMRAQLPGAAAKAAAKKAVAAENAQLRAQEKGAEAPAQTPKAPEKAPEKAPTKPPAKSAGQLNIGVRADTVAPPTVIMREAFDYERNGRRDPFVSLLTTNQLRPTLSDLKLTGILYDMTGRHSVAKKAGGNSTIRRKCPERTARRKNHTIIRARKTGEKIARGENFF